MPIRLTLCMDRIWLLPVLGGMLVAQPGEVLILADMQFKFPILGIDVEVHDEKRRVKLWARTLALPFLQGITKEV